jgi:serine protease AprX
MIKSISCLVATSRTCLALVASFLLLTTSVLAVDRVWVRIHHGADDPVLADSGALSGLTDYGSFQWGELNVSRVSDLRDQGLRLTVIDDPFTLDLGGKRFDPLAEDSPSTAGDGSDFHLVQFQGPILGPWLQNLRATGVEPVQYIHPYSYVVWADQSQLAAARSLDSIRATAAFAQEYRVSPQQRGRDPAVVPTMALVSRHVDEHIVRAQLEAAGATVHHFTPVTAHTSVVYLEVAGDRYWNLADIPALYTIQYIPPETGPRGEMSNQAVVGNYASDPNNPVIFTGYADWLNTSGYDGSGVIVGIVDGGIRVSHQDLVGNISPCVASGDSPTSCTTSNNGHGTHVAGAVAGTGNSGITDSNGFLRGQGVAPGASVIQQRYGSFLGGGPGSMIPNGMLMIYRESALSGAIITNNSWGPTGSPQGYDIPTQQIDIITRDALPEVAGNQGVLPVWSIMNGNGDSFGACAPSSLGSPDEAKNLFGVGATNLQVGGSNTNQVAGTGIFNLGSNSAHGPACDGRTGLHIVAPGWSTDSTSAGSDTAHGLAGGTSMASPVVSGAVAVFIEHYRDLHVGADPSPAMIKAAVTAVASNMHGRLNADGGTITQTPSRFQGYGRLDLDAVVNPAFDVMYFDQEHVFTAPGQDWSLSLMADDPDEPVRLMLMWTDAHGHGLGGTTPAWVNDLDLVVEAGADTYLGNVIGTDGFSESGGTADQRNNAEAVFLRPDQHSGSTFDVTVAAIDIAADALNPHDQGDPAQDFALVCYNCREGNSTFTLAVDPEAIAVCLPETGSVEEPVDVTVGVEADYAGTVALSASGLPTGVSSQFVPAAVEAPGQSVWTLSVDPSASAGISAISLMGDDGDEIKDLPFSLSLETAPEGPDLLLPAPDAVDVSLQPELSWAALEGVNNYQLQVATDAEFNDIVVAAWINDTSHIPSSMLAIGTDYFWRVRGLHTCGDGDWSAIREFRTRFDPVAAIDPGSLSVVVPMNELEVFALSIGNVGSGVLDWSISTESCSGGGPSDWLSVNPVSGAVNEQEDDLVDVMIDTQGLAVGIYSGALCVTTNQSEVDPVSVPVELEVVELPPGDPTVAPASLGFGDVGTGTSMILPVNISNVAEEGSADVVISQIAIVSGGAVYSIQDTDCAASLATQSQCSVDVQFSPTDITAYSGVLRITVDGQSINVGLMGNGIEPEPEIFHDRFEPQ